MYPFNSKPTRKKYSTDPKGTAKVKDFRKGDYIRLVDKKGKRGIKTYIRGDYDRELKKYHLVDTSDVFGNGRYVKGNILANDDFDY